ncbi:MAG: DUF4124 domain-containing protein [Hydrogenophaga sp.]|nr:DUF4124 domain-containing protein [Hydrogenophaga sp.]
MGALHGAWALTVYRCEANGKATYSHEPCIGAKAVDTTPTQGLDKSSGVSRKGADVRRDEMNRQLSDAMRPITGMSHEDRKTRHRRSKLSAAAQVECTVLDTRIANKEAAERVAKPTDLAEAQTALFQSRRRYRELGC